MKMISDRGKIVKACDKLLFEILKLERGNICEIHQHECPKIGPMHILNKAKYPRLRWASQNIILAGWFCSHYWTHHDPDDERSKFAKNRIRELRGENYRENLVILDKIQPKLTISNLKTLKISLELILDNLKKEKAGGRGEQGEQ